MKTMFNLLLCCAAFAFFTAACCFHNCAGQCGGNSPVGGTCSDTGK